MKLNLKLNLKNIIGALVAAVVVAGIAGTVIAADKNSDLEAKAKISKKEATKIALAKVPGGKVKDAELEEEKGKLVWSFDIATKGSKDITEVMVDAITGEIVSVATETPEDQKKEKDEDKKEKK
jgi:uncharacterized membrane protein YkoI